VNAEVDTFIDSIKNIVKKHDKIVVREIVAKIKHREFKNEMKKKPRYNDYRAMNEFN